MPDPAAIHEARGALLTDLARHAEAQFASLYDSLASDAPFSPAAPQAGRRALRNAALALLSRIDGGHRAARQFDAADNMTDSLAALAALLRAGAAGDALGRFETRWRDDRLVMNKWFSLQAGLSAPAEAVGIARKLTRHPDFDPSNPNRFRSVVGAFAMNQAGFHHASGEGYEFVADWILETDGKNPQIAARLASVFQTMPIWDEARQSLMKQHLERILAAKDLSRDTREMVTRLHNG